MMTSVAAISSLGATSHNPRGNLWFNDDTTFGRKLLMKMGWSKGKGLGKNEDGIKENLKVKLRSTNSGLGFKDDAYANVMKNEYESILQKLKPQYSSQVTSNSTDEPEKPKAKVVRNRLRYPRLFFGKDVTKYSEKDMKSIFICSQPIGETQEKDNRKVISQKPDSENNLSKPGDIIKSDLSISEYFAMKMKEKKGNISNKSAAVHSDQQTSFELSKSETENLSSNENLSCKRKRKRLEIKTEEDYSNELNLHSSIMQCKDIKTENLVEFSVESPSKKRKRKFGISSKLDEVNSYTNENECKSSDENGQNPSTNSLGVFVSPSKKNEKSQLSQNEYCVPYTTEMIWANLAGVEFPVFNKKKKKIKKEHHFPAAVKHSLENPNFEKEKLLEKNTRTVNGFSFSKFIDNELLNLNTNRLEKKNKQKKKLKEKLKSCLKSKRDSYILKNVSFNENVSYRILDTDINSVEGLAKDESEDEVEFSNVDSNASVSATSEDETTLDESCSTDHEDLNLVETVTSDKVDFNSDLCSDIQNVCDKESNELFALSSLPSSKSPYYNNWIASQKQALQMNLYKEMLKNIETHDVLRTTNLLSIKGYGNWGF